MPRTLLSFRGLILVFGLVAVGLPIALVGQLGNVRTLNAAFLEIARIREDQLAIAAVYELQVEEEAAVRGFAATGQRAFLVPYFQARAATPRRIAELRAHLHDDSSNGPEDRAVDDIRARNAEWLRTVAEPVVASTATYDTRVALAKRQVDGIRNDVRIIRRILAARYEAAIARRDRSIRTTTVTALTATVAIGIEILVFAIVFVRMRRELDRDRAVVESLQITASARLVPPAHLAVGTVYRSATRGARVGGDAYDVYRLDEDRTLLVVADVSGKGLTAAVDTTFVRYAVRALASEMLPPDEIVRRFDDLYRGATAAPEAFVTLFVGIHDRRDGTVAYTNAGHEAVWVRRGAELEMLAPTGPIVGLGGFRFEVARAALLPGELLILGTDGLTEARDPVHGFVPIEEVNAWLIAADPRDPQRFVEAILARVAQYGRRRITDDLALLAVSPREMKEKA